MCSTLTTLNYTLSTDKALSVVNDCFQSAHLWLDANELCLNPDKTKAIVIGTTARQRLEPQVDDVTVAGITVPVTRTVKSLGVTIDNTLSFDDHVDNVCTMQGSSFTHSGSTSHPPVCVSRWCKDSCDHVGIIPAGLLQLDTELYCTALLRPTSTNYSVCRTPYRVPSWWPRNTIHNHITQVLAHLHWLPDTGCIHSLPINRVTFTTYCSRTARHDNSGLPVTTCLKFRGWEPVSLNAASPTVLHTSGTVYLTSSLATWTSLQTLSKRNSKRFITLTATRRSTW